MALSEVWIVNDAGHPLAFKKYRQDISFQSVEEFGNVIRENPVDTLEPTMVIKDVIFIHIRRHNLYFLATSCAEVNPIFAVELLSRLYQLCKDFCGVVNEDSVTKNYVLIQEILDELLDFGYVQLASTEKVKPYIQSTPVMTRTAETLTSGLFGVEHRPTPGQASNKSVIKSRIDQDERKNEIFIDIVERIVAVIDAKGIPQRCEVQGSVNMKTFLMGTPQVRVTFNDNIILGGEEVKSYGKQIYLEDVKFHSCVNHTNFDSDKIITIQPPQGEFSVMSYKVNGDLVHGLPLRLYSYVNTHTSSRDIEVGLKLRCEIPASSQAVNIKLQLPVPQSVKSISQQLGGPGQSADFILKDSVLHWNVKHLPGKAEAASHFKLIEGNLHPDTNPAEQVGPVTMDFEISGFLCSNLQVKNLNVHEREQFYAPSKWVRYITTPDSYIIKLH